jgi:predicted dehydrogenase
MIKIGLIGCGKIMPAHLHGYKILIEKKIDVRITALCARKINDAMRFRSSDDGVPQRKSIGPPDDPLAAPHIYVSDFQKDTEVEVYDDYKKMLKNSDIDAVDIYSSVCSHHPIALASLEAGKDVLIEKPLAITVKAARIINEMAEKKGRILGVAENIHYSPDIKMTKWILNKGFIGKIQAVAFGIFGGYWSPNKIIAETPWRHIKLHAGGGASIDMGVHVFHMFRYLIDEVEEVQSNVKTLQKVRVTTDDSGNIINQVRCEVDDTFFTSIKFRNKVVGYAFFSWAGCQEPILFPRTIYGEKGCIKDNIVILNKGTNINVESFFKKNATQKTKNVFFPFGIEDPMALETLDFLYAIMERRDMETNGLEGIRDLAASYAMIESSLAKTSVKVDDVESGKIENYEAEINKYYNL